MHKAVFAALAGALSVFLTAQASVNSGALSRLRARAFRTHTDSLFIVKDNQIVAEDYFATGRDEKVHTMSLTKSVVNLAFGVLEEQGVLPDLNTPVSDFFSQWRDDSRSEITLDHLLTHTSCLRDAVFAPTVFLFPNHLAASLGQQLLCKPGTEFVYNNMATNILTGVVEKISGRPVDELVKDHIFEPLDIRDTYWIRDLVGNPYGMAGLHIRARDLAKIGQLMLRRGNWNGLQIVEPRWIDRSTRNATSFDPLSGRLWWAVPEWEKHSYDEALLERYRKAGLDERTLSILKLTQGKKMSLRETYDHLFRWLGVDGATKFEMFVVNNKLPWSNAEYGRPIGFEARGVLGQFVTIIPSRNLVAVRLISVANSKNSDTFFTDFRGYVLDL